MLLLAARRRRSGEQSGSCSRIDNHRSSATEALEHDFSHQHYKAISRDEPGSRRHGA
jgi:hypothetical protein